MEHYLAQHLADDPHGVGWSGDLVAFAEEPHHVLAFKALAQEPTIPRVDQLGANAHAVHHSKPARLERHGASGSRIRSEFGHHRLVIRAQFACVQHAALAAREEAQVGHTRLQNFQRFVRPRAGGGRELVDLVALELPLLPPEQQQQHSDEYNADEMMAQDTKQYRSRCTDPPAGVSASRSSAFCSLVSALTLAAPRCSNSADLTLSRSPLDRNVCSASKRVNTATCHILVLSPPQRLAEWPAG
ncbi:unnamed protein product [Phytophthora fragariaefolia]|uniref:Unnamed protein product n=1 Tax=Phytophthora fragariaefolia TaxID=1490495 RepID=A0A9W6WT05_9STRA|nr:unnamed protein product [Phytophthora fragariaefolia]